MLTIIFRLGLVVLVWCLLTMMALQVRAVLRDRRRRARRPTAIPPETITARLKGDVPPDRKGDC